MLQVKDDGARLDLSAPGPCGAACGATKPSESSSMPPRVAQKRLRACHVLLLL
jgi:hypothetical protein